MKFDCFDFLIRPQSNQDFASICENLPRDNFPDTIKTLRKMPNYDIFAFKIYTEQRESVGAVMWAQAEIQRREFLLNQIALAASILAVCISIIALFN